MFEQPFLVEEGFRFLDVHLESDDLIVMFRWKRDPNTYGFRYQLPAPQDRREPPSGSFPSTPEHVAADLYGDLQEELATGLVFGARRIPRSRWVELDWHHREPGVPGYFVGEAAAKRWREVDLRALAEGRREESTSFGWTSCEPLPPAADEQEDLHRALLAQTDTRHSVVVGVLMLELPGPTAPDPQAEIHGLRILKEHQGRGLESELVDAAVARARVDGALRVSCRTGQPLSPLLERLGFVEHGDAWVRSTVDVLG